MSIELFATFKANHKYYFRLAIMGSIRRHKHAMSALLAEFIDKEDLELSGSLTDDASR